VFKQEPDFQHHHHGLRSHAAPRMEHPVLHDEELMAGALNNITLKALNVKKSANALSQ